MKTFSITFNGYYPVGACAVVIAQDKDTAIMILEARLVSMNLTQKIHDSNIKEIDTRKCAVHIILEGEY